MPFLYMCGACFNRDQTSGLLISQNGGEHIRACPYRGKDTAKLPHVFKNEMVSRSHAIATKAGRADTGTVMALALTVPRPRKLSADTWATWGGVSPARPRATISWRRVAPRTPA